MPRENQVRIKKIAVSTGETCTIEHYDEELKDRKARSCQNSSHSTVWPIYSLQHSKYAVNYGFYHQGAHLTFAPHAIIMPPIMTKSLHGIPDTPAEPTIQVVCIHDRLPPTVARVSHISLKISADHTYMDPSNAGAYNAGLV